MNFNEWFESFWKELNTKPESVQVLKEFKKYYYNDWFMKGFKARMYRTWISVLTQLDFCYMFEYICAKEGKNFQLECNAEVDAKGIDARVNNIGFQIAKISRRKEARTAGGKKSVVTIPYAVLEEFERRCKSNRVKDKTALDSFHKYFIRLENGFVVFNENYLRAIIDNIDDIEAVKRIVKKISLELSGES